MKIPDGYIPKSLYVDNSESVEGAKADRAEHQISEETTKPATHFNTSNAAAKKAELAMTGQAQAASMQWKSMGDGSVKDTQRQINEYRHQRGLPPIKEDGINGPEIEKAARGVQADQVDLERLQADASTVQAGPTAEQQMSEALSKPGKDDPFEVKLADKILRKLNIK
jgi:hypothetical protein